MYDIKLLKEKQLKQMEIDYFKMWSKNCSNKWWIWDDYIRKMYWYRRPIKVRRIDVITDIYSNKILLVLTIFKKKEKKFYTSQKDIQHETIKEIRKKFPKLKAVYIKNVLLKEATKTEILNGEIISDNKQDYFKFTWIIGDNKTHILRIFTNYEYYIKKNN